VLLSPEMGIASLHLSYILTERGVSNLPGGQECPRSFGEDKTHGPSNSIIRDHDVSDK
jgi:hypothetical protein